MFRAVYPCPARQVPLQKLFLRCDTCSGLSLKTGHCRSEQGCCVSCRHRTRKKIAASTGTGICETTAPLVLIYSMHLHIFSHPPSKKQQTRLLPQLPQCKSRSAWIVMEFAAPSTRADVVPAELAAAARKLCPTQQQRGRDFPGKRNFSILIWLDRRFQLQTTK